MILRRNARPFRFDRTWELPTPPTSLWETLTHTDEYVNWWSWLREFDAPGLVPGATARCTIQSPFPYSLRCRIHVDEVQPARAVVTTVDGDLAGRARLEIQPAGRGSTARLVWSVALTDSTLAALSIVARPAMTWAHDQVVEVGVAQFVRRALSPDGRDDNRGRVLR